MEEAYDWNHVLYLCLCRAHSNQTSRSAFHSVPRSHTVALSIISPTLPNNNGPSTNISTVFSYIELGCLRCFSNNIPQRKQGFRSYKALYSLDPDKTQQQCFRVSHSPPVPDILMILPRSPEILHSIPWRTHSGRHKPAEPVRKDNHKGRHEDTWMGTWFLIPSPLRLQMCFSSHIEMKVWDEGLNSTLETFKQKGTCSRTAVLRLGHALLACRKPAFSTPFWICDSIGGKPKPLGS